MRKKLKNITALFLTLIISNIGCIGSSFAEINNIDKSVSSIFVNKENNKTLDNRPDKIIDLQVTSKSSNCIKIEWCSVKCASGYTIYRSTMKSGIYRKLAQVSGKTTSYVDKDLNCGTNYYYRVRAFRKVGNKTCLGYPSDILEAATCPEAIKYLHAECVSDCSIELGWETIYKSSGYELYRSTSENGNYTRVATFTDNGKTCYRDNNLKSGKKYYYKVRAFKELNGQIAFGNYSDVLGVCTRK